jgi:hypothetical protein
MEKLQTAIRDEKIVRPSSHTLLINKHLKKAIDAFGLIFSPRRIAFAGLGIFVFCTFISVYPA